MKKLLALVLALLLVLGLATTAFAAGEHTETDSHTLTITPTNPSVPHTYQAYQVFSGVLETGEPKTDGSGQVNTIAWGSGVNGPALLTALKAATFPYNADFADANDAADVAAVLATYTNNSDKLKAVSDVIAQNLTTTFAQGTAPSGPVTISGLSDGYYFVKDKEGTQDIENGSYTDFMLDVVGDTTVTAKDVLPSLEKKIKEGSALVDASNGSMGDKVEYQLSSTVPDMSAYESYKFEVVDTMSKGLTFNDDTAITIGSTTLDRVYKSSTGYYYASEDAATTDDNTAAVTQGFTVASSTDGTTGVTTITIYIVNFKQFTAGDAITIGYSATINENALVSTGNPNTARLNYSNNPNSSGAGTNGEPDPSNPSGHTPDDTVVTFTTGIELLKIDGNDPTKKLAGAVFTLTGDAKNVVITNSEIFVQDDASGTYWRLNDGTYTTEAPNGDTAHDDAYESTTAKYKKITEITTDYNAAALTSEATGATANTGLLEYTGLGEGLYTITETQAPGGYNLLDTPVYVFIRFVPNTTNPTTSTFEAYKYKGTGTPTAPTGTIDTTSGEALSMNATGTSNLEFDLQVENKSGSVLPSTGGIGTTIFYIVGSILVLGAGVVLVTRKRAGSAE